MHRRPSASPRRRGASRRRASRRSEGDGRRQFCFHEPAAMSSAETSSTVAPALGRRPSQAAVSASQLCGDEAEAASGGRDASVLDQMWATAQTVGDGANGGRRRKRWATAQTVGAGVVVASAASVPTHRLDTDWSAGASKIPPKGRSALARIQLAPGSPSGRRQGPRTDRSRRWRSATRSVAQMARCRCVARRGSRSAFVLARGCGSERVRGRMCPQAATGGSISALKWWPLSGH